MEKDNTVILKLPEYFQLHYLIDPVIQSCKWAEVIFRGEERKERKSLPKVPEPS